jgi:hypothetical protein
LKKVREFGSGTDDFVFQRISGVVLSNNKDIYVSDSRGHFVARYDWHGKLLKKIGQRGQGPKDFRVPSDLNLYDNKLFLNDRMNLRIAEIDLELKEVKYHRILTGEPFLGNFFIIGKDKCIGSAISYSVGHIDEYNRIKTFDYKTQAEYLFFDKMPVKGMKLKNLIKTGVLFINFSPCMGIDRKNKNVIVSFTYPNNPIEFFVYSYEGEFVDQFSYIFDEDYEYPDHFKTGKRSPKKYNAIIMYSIFSYKSHYISMVSETRYTGDGDFDSDLYCLIFDRKSKLLKHKLSIPNFLQFYSISEDGYLLGTRNFQDDIKVHVYKLEL